MSTKIMLPACIVIMMLLVTACGGDNEVNPTPTGPKPVTITINPTATHQEMVGFGGALTWYSDRIISSTNKEQIADLIFNDLGTDIIRFKNWYYPDNYPTVTSTEAMSDDNSKALWSVTNQLYEMAKDHNPNVKILFSSWGPPAGLKSNASSRQGTLKKDGSEFMYDAYADYWENILNNLPFNPDYISIQNEPTYINAGWTTCQWAETQTSSLPDYNLAFDKVYNKIKGRTTPPVMIGPESQDIPTFSSFANTLKNKSHCGMLAYHPYNINSGTSTSQIISSLKSIGAFSTKSNIMTEFSDNLNWFNTAQFIQNTLVHANSSGYIYWKLVWATPDATSSDAGMVSINAAGQYTVTPFYYVMKHFAKHITAGYYRVDASSSNENLNISAFVNESNTKLTLIIINTGIGQVKVDFNATGKTIASVSAVQSVQGVYYKTIESTTPASPITLPSQTITTVVLDI